MKNVGIIGTGKHGSRYASHIVKDISSLDLKAICRRSKEGEDQAREWGVKYHKEWKKLIHDKDVEAVISVVPPWLNLGIAQECSRVNKPLLVEKPLAVNGTQAREIVSYMESCQLTVAQTLRFNPVIQSMKKRINDMGKIYSIHANQRLEPSSLAWHDKKEIAGAGVLIHTAVHIFDALHYITGKKITRVMAASYRYHSKVLEDLVTLLFEMEGGIVGTVDISKVGHGRSGGYEFVCEKGQFQADQVHGTLGKVINNDKQQVKSFQPIPTISLLLQQWSDYLHQRGKNPVTGADGLYAVQVCDACLQSARSQSWVEV